MMAISGVGRASLAQYSRCYRPCLRRECFTTLETPPPRNEMPPAIPRVECDNNNDNNDDDYDDRLAEALKPYYYEKPSSAVVLRGFLQHHPKWKRALHEWQEWDHLHQRILDGSSNPNGAPPHFDVEIGNYNQGGGGKSNKVCIPFDHYRQYLQTFREMYGSTIVEDDKPAPPVNQILYLAQNDVPAGLLSEVHIPQFCRQGSASPLGHGQLYQCQWWMGPPYAHSPLHYDPLDNLLCQVVGRKRVLVMDPSQATPDQLYVGREYGQQPNTSAVPLHVNGYQVEPRAVLQYPKTPPLRTVAQHALLEPGDVLFVPSKWWHSARSLDFSISVNVWWR